MNVAYHKVDEAEQISEWNSVPLGILVDRVAFPLSSLSLQASAIDWELSKKGLGILCSWPHILRESNPQLHDPGERELIRN